MIFGIGIDIVDQKRIRISYGRFGDIFLQKFLFPQEITHINTRSAEHIAALFALKEATIKACGSAGLRIGYSAIFIHHADNGAPKVRITDPFFEPHGSFCVHASVSHEKDYAVGLVILEKL